MDNQKTSAADQVTENLRQTLRTGVRFNEMSARGLRLMLRQTDLAQEWQQSFSRFALLGNELMSATQKQANELLALMSHSAHAKIGLMAQAVDAAGDSTVSGSHSKWLEFWGNALKLAQSNAVAVVQINTRAMNSWLRLAG